MAFNRKQTALALKPEGKKRGGKTVSRPNEKAIYLEEEKELFFRYTGGGSEGGVRLKGKEKESFKAKDPGVFLCEEGERGNHRNGRTTGFGALVPDLCRPSK